MVVFGVVEGVIMHVKSRPVLRSILCIHQGGFNLHCLLKVGTLINMFHHSMKGKRSHECMSGIVQCDVQSCAFICRDFILTFC